MVTAPKKVVPGDQICKYDETCVLGGGLHVHQGIVYSTLLGEIFNEPRIRLIVHIDYVVDFVVIAEFYIFPNFRT